MRPLLWLEDFNDHLPEAPTPEPELQDDAPPEPPPPDPVKEAWNEGYLAGCRLNLRNARDDGNDLAAELRRSLTELEQKLETIANISSAEMGGLLIDMLAHAIPADWPQPISEKLKEAIEAVRPCFMLDPKFRIDADPPGELDFRDLPGFYKALEADAAPQWPIGVNWRTEGTAEQSIAVLNQALATSG